MLTQINRRFVGSLVELLGSAEEMRATNKLTALGIARAKRAGRYADGGNLYLQISDSGTKAWLFRFMRHGKAREMGLGPVDIVSLAQAREAARNCRKLLLQGVDPIDQREARKAAVALESAKAVTFGECARGYIEANQSGWKNGKHAEQWRMTLLGIDPKGKPARHDYCRSIRDLPVNAVDDVQVMKILQPIWQTKTETANRIRGRIEKVLDRAKALKLRSGDNPARWVGHLDQLLPKKSQVAPVRNHPALPYQQLPQFMADLRKRQGISARALEFTILTAARTAETIGATRSEIDRHEKLWTIPKDRMKGKKGARKRDHTVPLPRQAVAILDSLPQEGDFLFEGENVGEPLSGAAMAAVIDRMNEDRVKAGLAKWVDPQQGGREIVPHGFRSTFKDWCSEQTEFPNDMSELALAHTLPDKVEAAYRRGDMRVRRSQMMIAWAAFCESKPIKSNVIPLRA